VADVVKRTGPKILVGTLVVAVLMSVVSMAHFVVAIGIPYPDPTPEQAAQERHHLAISNILFVSAGGCWLLTAVVALFWFGRRLRGGRHPLEQGE
jgi:hypothetical protein